MDSGDESDTPIPTGTPASIILINAYDPKSKNTAQVAHAATCQLIRHYLRTMRSYFIGVTFYGTETPTNSNTFNTPCVKDIIPLNSLSTVSYKTLKNTDVSKIPQASQLILSDVFAHCSKAFSNCKRKLSSRTIFMLSSFDISPGEQDELGTLEAVSALADSNTEIILINISQSQYEPNSFYYKLMKEANKVVGENIHLNIPEPIWDEKIILQKIIVQSDRHLAIAKLKLEIRDDISIGVRIYKLLKDKKDTKPKSQKINKNYENVTTSGKLMKMTVDETDSEEKSKLVPILKPELLWCQKYGGETIIFTDNEYNHIRNPFGQPKIKLLGFKPATLLCKEKWFLKNCYFLFPDELTVEGSNVAFGALHHACVKANVVAICILSTRANARLLIAALSPCNKPLGQDISIGFDVIPIPFAENLRDTTFDENEDDIKITEEQRSVMKSVIESLKFDYQPDMFEDPVVDKLLNVIEDKALGDIDDNFKDTTLKDDSHFKSIDDGKFLKLFGPFTVNVPKKRTNATNTGTSNKKKKTENIDEDLLNYRIANNKIDKYTNPELKQILHFKEASESISCLNKKTLVELVYKYCK